jgi:hypothetical protein
VIVQLSAPVQFINASRIVVPLKPSAPRSILVLAVVITFARGGLLLRVSDNLAMTRRWRQANADGGRHLWYRLQSPHAGVAEVIIETPNELQITGRAVLAEMVGVNAGQGVQLLSDLLLESESSIGTGRANY